VRALVGAQQTLKRDPGRAQQAAKRLFPETEAGLIAELIRRDAPYYDAAISTQSVDALTRFTRDLGLLTEEVSFDQVVATGFRHLWNP
jgi:ABC-type nitrate/sulfonate/bicarbonate transport system substrate-binding protein